MGLRRSAAVLGLLGALASSAAPASPVSPEAPPAPAGVITSFDAAAAFGARPGVADLSLSPDGKSVAYIAPAKGQGSMLMTLELAEGSKAHIASTASGKPERFGNCHWVSDQRLVCVIYGVVKNSLGLLPFTRTVAVNRDGSAIKMLSTANDEYTRGLQLAGGDVIDWLPDEDGAVLMSRVYLPDDHLGSHLGSDREGLAVDRLDTRNLQIKTIEIPAKGAREYLSDGRGTIRIVGRSARDSSGQDSGVVAYSYRKPGSREWLKLGDYNSVDGSGFAPAAVDHDLNVVYGFKKKDGRNAIYTIALDGSLSENLTYSRPDVDVDDLIRIGRRNRVVGVSFATDVRHAVYFDPDIEKLMRSLARALPRQAQLQIVDSSVDEHVLLIFAGSDDDPGVYYLFDRPSKQLRTFLVVRDQLEGVKLAKVKPVSYPAGDGEMVPGYLTLPPGVSDAKGLPAIVLPHGGPSDRDEWGFDWLSQYYASRGFAVLQPNFRGSAGYGDAWLQKKGFQSWRIAIGDVLDAGRWLVAQGIADPTKLCVVGWSYGGYAALQSAVTDQSLFKAVVAIAPVTDLQALKEEHRDWSDFNLVSDMIGDGPHVREGSPARNAEKIKVPVLMFHAAFDRNVGIAQSRLMASRLESAGVKHELVTWDDLDHHLDDSAARTEMLRKSDAFLRQAIGQGP
jgi:dipeptidyl aminopeptidase/acylaminoacyl peptidase